MKNKKLLRTAAALLLIGVGVVSAGCSFEIEQPDWVTQALCDHVFDEEVLEEVTCTEDGRVMKVCTDCGKTKIVTVKATGHDVVEDEAVDATCTTPGLTAGSHCTACGEVLVKQEEVVGEHTYGAWTVDVAATCTTEGQQKRVCSVCGETETEAISAAHVDAANDGTCDVCEGSIFENATYASVSEGDSLAGWYRVPMDTMVHFCVGFRGFDIEGYSVENMNDGYIDLYYSAGAMGMIYQFKAVQLNDNHSIYEWNYHNMGSITRDNWVYFYIPENIAEKLQINNGAYKVEENVPGVLSGLYLKSGTTMEKVNL